MIVCKKIGRGALNLERGVRCQAATCGIHIGCGGRPWAAIRTRPERRTGSCQAGSYESSSPASRMGGPGVLVCRSISASRTTFERRSRWLLRSLRSGVPLVRLRRQPLA